MLADEELRGVQVGEDEIKIAHFEDDTTFYLRDWSQLGRMWQLLEEWGEPRASAATEIRRKA